MPHYSLKGKGEGIANNQEELLAMLDEAMRLSPTGQVELTEDANNLTRLYGVDYHPDWNVK